MIFFGILVSLIMFSLIVLFHEFGHFKSARFFGVKVEEFGLGIPPKAKKLFTDKKGTVYTLNWLPLGGFVKLKGEQFHQFLIYNENKKRLNNSEILKKLDKHEDLFDKSLSKLTKSDRKLVEEKLKENLDNDNLINKAYWKQAIIILGGVFMNFLLAIIIFSILFMIGVKPIGVNTKLPTSLDVKLIPTYEQALSSGLIKKEEGVLVFPIEGSIAQNSGLQENDNILEIAGKKIESNTDFISILKENPNKELDLTVNRNGETVYIIITPSEEGKIGSYVGDKISYNDTFIYKYGFIDSIKYGTIETYNQSLLTLSGLSLLAKNIFTPETKEQRKEAIDNLAGPIGIVGVVTDALAGGLILIIILGAIISINLGVFNLLPIPALDGGRFVFICINSLLQKITGKKGISPYIEGSIHVFFFLMLIGLSILIAYNDIHKLFTK